MKSNSSDIENSLWENYMNNNEEDSRWLKETKLPIDTDFFTYSYATYNEEEFLKQIEDDKSFRQKWGSL